MKSRLAFFITILTMMGLLITSFSTLADNSTCRLSLIVDKQTIDSINVNLSANETLRLPLGNSLVKVNCTLEEDSVFSFTRTSMGNVTWPNLHKGAKELAASTPSFLLTKGTIDTEFTIHSQHESIHGFTLEPIPDYVYTSLINSMTMALFYGLCLTLIFYVYFTGRVLGDTTFIYYSLYIFCAATFFLLQEGQLNIILPAGSFIQSHPVFILFAGLTVMSATMFIIRIADLHIAFPKMSYYGLQPLAGLALLLSLLLMWIEQGTYVSVLENMVSALTLLIMVSVSALVVLQVFRKVELAWLILISLFIMVIAMLFRVIGSELDLFLNRYALIIGFAIEAFIFAMLVSFRVKHIQEEKVRAQTDANTDVLSNLLNRRGWEANASKLIEYQHKHGGLLCLLYIDLDNFKSINDSYGHDCGDKLLIIVSKIIRNQTRQKDIIGRIGGDEFVVVGHFKSEQEPSAHAQRMRERLSKFSVQVELGTMIEASASVGQLIISSPPSSVSEMLKQADESMYRFKQERKLASI